MSEPEWEALPDPQLPLDLQLLQDERYRRLRACIRALPERERRVVVLRFGLLSRPLTVRETAEALGTSKSTVQRTHRDALGHLRCAYDLPVAA